MLFRSSFDRDVGSTLDIWSRVIPRHVVRKPRTMVMSDTADAFRPW